MDQQQHFPQELLELVLKGIGPEVWSLQEIAILRLVGRGWRDFMAQVVGRVRPKDMGPHGDLQDLMASLQERYRSPGLTLDLTQIPSASILIFNNEEPDLEPLMNLLRSLVWPGFLVLAGGLRSMALQSVLNALMSSSAYNHIIGLTVLKDFRDRMESVHGVADDQLLGHVLNRPLRAFASQLRELVIKDLELVSLSACTVLTQLTILTRLEFQGGVLKETPQQLTSLVSLSCLVFENCHMKVKDAFKMKHMPRCLTHLSATHSHIAMNIHPQDLLAHTRLTHLDLSNNKIGALPATLGHLKDLDLLDVSHNSLVSLPSSITNLHRLKVLRVAHNKIKSLPRKVAGLFWIQHLDLSFNALMHLPDDLHQLIFLKCLDVRGNPVRTPLPAQLQNWLSQGQMETCLYDPHLAPPRKL